MKKLFSLLILGSFLQLSTVFAQNPISIEFLQEDTAANLEATYGIPAEYDVEFYKLTYTTPDVHAVQDTASGLLIIPKDRSNQYPMLTYQHGTVADRNTAMSNLEAADVTLATIYASFGFITVAPDYLGMEEARGFHPYMHAATEASAALDMMRAVTRIDKEDLEFHFNDRTFITGYSQGGHAAMALHREIETNYPEEFNVVAAVPMSGPYSISEKMIEFTLGDTEYFFVAYLPNVALSYKLAYPELLAEVDLEDIFKPAYIDEIRRFENGEIDLFELNQFLIDKLIELEGASIPKLMMHDSTYQNIINNPSHPLTQALADNDVYDWAPKSFTRLYYCLADDQVSYTNALLAEEVMIANGATLTSATNISDTEDHGGCVNPSINAAIQFLYLFRGITTSTDELLTTDQFTASPNPAKDIIHITVDPTLDHSSTVYRILDMNGKIVLKNSNTSNRLSLDISQLNPGMYILEAIGDNYRGIKRFSKI